MHIFLILTLSFCWASASLGEVKIISATAGVYLDKVISSREAEISFQLELALNSKAPSNRPLVDKVSDLLVEKVVFLEAENFALQAPLAEYNQKKESLTIPLKQNKNWILLDVQPREFENSLREKIFAKAFIQFKADSFQSIVTDQEIRAYFDKNRDKFSGLKFENFKESIKNFLVQQGRDEKLRTWFESLRKKYKVKNLLVHNS